MNDIILKRSSDLDTTTCFIKGMTKEQIKSAVYKAQADSILLLRGKSENRTQIEFKNGSSLEHLKQLREEQKWD